MLIGIKTYTLNNGNLCKMALPERVIAILDMGHGNSTVIKDTDRIIIVDAGPGSGLLEFLTEQGVQEINALLISHADQDHIGGVMALLSSGLFRVGIVRVNTDSIKGSKAWDDLLYELDQLGNQDAIDFRPSLTVRDSGEFDLEFFKIQILGPSNYLAGKGPGSTDRDGRRISTNTISTVIRILDQKLDPIVLLPGDIDAIGLDDLVNHEVVASAPILVYPHHGGFSGSPDMVEEFTIRLCRLVRPATVIFSNGRGYFDTPRPEIVSTLRKNVDRVRILCTQLSEHCARNLPQSDPVHLADVYSRGRESHRCCAGSVVIDISLPEPIVPIVKLHQEFVNSVAPTALCNS